MNRLGLFLSAAVLMPPQARNTYVDHRVLMVFGAKDEKGLLEKQMELLKNHSEDLKERDLIVVQSIVVANDRTPDAWRIKYHIAPTEFTVILIGKDGGEKLRQHIPLTYEKLAATIDAMPMRQDEMKREKK